MEFSIGIAIIERNERPYITYLLKSVFEACKKCECDIYVIDGGSTDGTIELLHKVFVPLGVKIAFDKGKGLGAAHNLALHAIEENIVFFTFGDEYVSSTWICTALKWFNDPKVAAVFGPVYILKPSTLLEKYADWKLRRYFSKLRPGQHFPYAAATNLAVRRDIALEVGGFREDLIDADDAEFTYRLSKAGYRVVYEPRMVVYHQKAEEAELGTLIRATMLVAFGYGQVAAIHGLNWHPVCKVYFVFLPSLLLWFVLLLLQPLMGLYIALSLIAVELLYFLYHAVRDRSLIPLIGTVVEPLRLVFASFSFLLGYIYQRTLYRYKHVAMTIRKLFDYVRLHVGH